MNGNFSLASEFQQQAFMERFNSMANNMQTSDPRLQELLNMLSKLLLGQTMNGLSPNWQTGFEYLGRAVVNSPLGSMMGLHNGADSFTTYHNAIMQQGALPMTQFGTGATGYSYGAGSNTLGAAYALQQHNARFARGTGLNQDLVAGFIAANIQNNGFAQGDIVSYGGRDVTSAADILNLYSSVEGKTSEETHKGIGRAAVIAKAKERYAKHTMKAPQNMDWDAFTQMYSTSMPKLNENFKNLHESDKGQWEKYIAEAQRELKLEDLDMSNVTSAEVDSVLVGGVTGFSYTGLSDEFINKNKAALNKHAKNLKDLSEIFDTKNFTELDAITETLQMGSFQNEKHVKQMGERIESAKRLALTTNRDVKEVLAEQGSLLDILGMASGGRSLVNNNDINYFQRVKATYDRNSERGYDFRTEAEMGADMMTSVANRRELFGNVMLGSYLLEDGNNLLDQKISGTDTTYASRVKELVEKFKNSTDRDEQTAIDAEIKDLLKPFGSFISDYTRKAAFKKGSLDVNEATRGGLIAMNAGLVAEDVFSSADAEITQALGSEKEMADAMGNIMHVFGEDVESAENFLKAVEKSPIALKHYVDLGMKQEDIERLRSVGKYLRNGEGGSYNSRRAGLFKNQMVRAQVLGRAGVGTHKIAEEEKVATDAFFNSLQNAHKEVSFNKDNAFFAALLGDSNELTDAGALLAMNATGSKVAQAGMLKDGKFSAEGMDKEAMALLGLSGVDTSKYTEKDWYRVLSKAEKNGVVVATDAEGKTFVAKKDEAFLKKKEEMAKEADKLKGLAGMAKHMAGVSNMTLNAEGELAITYTNNGKDTLVGGKEAYARLLELKNSGPEGAAAYKEFMENSSDPAMSKIKDELKEYETLHGIKFNEEAIKDMDAWGWGYFDSGDKVDTDSVLYKAMPQFFDAYQKIMDQDMDLALRSNNPYEMFNQLKAKDPAMAKQLMSNGTFDAINQLAGRSEDELKGLGFIDEDGKFTEKAGKNLVGENAKLLVDALQGASKKEPPTLSLMEQILGLLRGLVDGSHTLRVDMKE